MFLSPFRMHSFFPRHLISDMNGKQSFATTCHSLTEVRAFRNCMLRSARAPAQTPRLFQTNALPNQFGPCILVHAPFARTPSALAPAWECYLWEIPTRPKAGPFFLAWPYATPHASTDPELPFQHSSLAHPTGMQDRKSSEAISFVCQTDLRTSNAGSTVCSWQKRAKCDNRCCSRLPLDAISGYITDPTR